MKNFHYMKNPSHCPLCKCEVVYRDSDSHYDCYDRFHTFDASCSGWRFLLESRPSYLKLYYHENPGKILISLKSKFIFEELCELTSFEEIVSIFNSYEKSLIFQELFNSY